MITTPAGGGREYKWLAESYAWSKDGKTLTINIRKGVKWTDGKPLTAADVVYSLTAGKQDPTMDILGTTREGTNIAAVQQKGTYTVLIKLKSRDSEFVSVNLNGIFVVPKHVFSKVADINKFLNPNPVGSGPFVRVSQFSTQSFVIEKNNDLLAEGRAEDPLPPVHPGDLERRRAAADRQRPGRLDAQLRPERREGIHRQEPEPLPRLLRDDGLSDLADVRHAEVPVQHRRLPQGRQPGDRPEQGLEARRVRLRAAHRRDRPARAVPVVARQDRGGQGEGCSPTTTRRRRRSSSPTPASPTRAATSTTRRATASSSTST